MAINETIVTGRKFRKLVDEANKLWQRISFWTKASDVEFNDKKTAENKVGAINGVTDSLTSTSSNIAASAAAVKTLNDKITELSSNINTSKTIQVRVSKVPGWAQNNGDNTLNNLILYANVQITDLETGKLICNLSTENNKASYGAEATQTITF